MTKQGQASSRRWHERLKDFAERFGVTFVVAAIVSGAIAVAFQVHLENSKMQSAALIESKNKFDVSHNEIVAQIGVYTNELYTKKHSANKERILIAIINAQSQLLELKHGMGDNDDPKISAYARELNSLQGALDNVSSPMDLGPVYVSVQRLLEDHEQVADDVKKHAEISTF